MLENDPNKLNRLEELKSKLFSKNYQTRTEHRGEFSHPLRKVVPDSWRTEEKAESNGSGKFFMKTSIFKKFFVFSAVFFVLALGYASYFFLAGGNTVSNDNIDLSILGNNFTAGGEDLSLVVNITNRNSSALDLVDLVVEYPKGSVLEDDSVSGTERLRESLGTIPAGAVRNENFRLVLFGEQGSVRPVKISLEYRVAGSNAIFVKEKIFNVSINSTPMNLILDAPTTASPNQDIELKVKTILNATRPVPKVLIRLDYPVGFSFVKAAPAPSFGNNVWDLGDFAPGAEREISITGRMTDVFDGEEKTFRVSSGSQSPTDKSAIEVVFNSIKSSILIEKPFVEANLYINGATGKEHTVDAKTQVNVEVRYLNNLDTRIDDLQIEAKLSGNAFNRKTVAAQQGFYNSSNDSVVWNKSSKSQLRGVDPGDSGSVTFSFFPLSLYSATGGMLSNPSVNIEVNVSGRQSAEGFDNELENSSSALVKIISDAGFSAKAFYYSGPFTNTGPIPPKVEQSTTYTVIWTLSNTANGISKARVNATLPPWVSFVGTFSPAEESLTYNSSTKEVVWNADRIPRGAGITGAARSVAFQISLSPSLSQVGTLPTIINDAILTGHDDFANVDIKATRSRLNTRLDSDTVLPGDGGVVVE